MNPSARSITTKNSFPMSPSLGAVSLARAAYPGEGGTHLAAPHTPHHQPAAHPAARKPVPADAHQRRDVGGVRAARMSEHDAAVLARDALDYDADTGIFTWKTYRNGAAVAGSVAGCRRSDGYIAIGIGKRYVMAHRLVYFFEHGRLPPAQIDHINRVRHDNRRVNLRVATMGENQRNAMRRSSSPYRGVNQVSGTTWCASVCHNRQRHYLGIFTCPRKAARAYDALAIQLHGEFAITNVSLGRLKPLDLDN